MVLISRQRRKGVSNQQGFTIVEFMIATAVFSLVILLCSYAIIHIGMVYYKGVITNRTQDAARRLSDDLVTAIQFGPVATDPSQFRRIGTNGDGDMHAVCLGTNRYSYVTDKAQGGGADKVHHVLWKDRVDDTLCEPVDLNNPGTDGQSLLGDNMRLSEFIVDPTGVDGQWSVAIRVSYGDTADLFELDTDGNTDFGVCRGVLAGGQFCAVSAFQTKVTKRL